MKKIVIIAVLSLVVVGMVLPQAKPGGIARQLALGGSQAGLSTVMNPFLWDDPSMVLFNPAYQHNYRDYMWSNIAGGQITGADYGDGYGYQNAGVAFGLSNAFTLGMILSYDPSAANYVNSLPDDFPGMQRSSQDIPDIENVWEAVATMRFTGMTLGLGIMYGWSNNDYTVDQVAPTTATLEQEASSSVLGFRLGALMQLSDDIDLGVTGVLRLDNTTDMIEYSPGVTGYGGTYEASGTEIQLSARAKIKMSNSFNFVPYAMLSLLSAEPKETEAPVGLAKTTATLEASATVYAFGIGGEYRMNDFLFVGGLSWQHAEIESDQKATVDTVDNIMGYTGFPVINIGGEWQITEWLAGRVGYYRAIGSVKQESKYPNISYEQNISYPHSMLMIGSLNPGSWDGLVTLGVGLDFGGFALDATVSEEALRRGIGLIGASDAINTFGYITASYNFHSK
jgi:hypothetical protein